MIEDYYYEKFITMAHQCGNAELMLCSSGNLSIRVAEYALISGTGSWLPAITKDKISLCRIADGVVMNGVKPSMESGFHLEILRNRLEINTVLHSQSNFATTISCMSEKPANFNVTAEIPCHCGKEIPIVPYFRPGSAELAKAVTAAMQHHDCVLLSKHGQVVCGKNFDDVFQKALFFEMACRIIVQSGFKYEVLTEQEIKDLEHYVSGKQHEHESSDSR